MSADSKQSLPVWVLKWKMAKGGRGRKHAAIFISNPDHANDHPLTTAKCESTEYEVAGSPFGGFSLNVRHNWDSTAVAGLESATQVGWVNEEDRSRTDNIALTVRPPGPTSRPWIAEEVMDCQDWVAAFVEQMVQQKVIAGEAPASVSSIMNSKTPVMPAPGQTSGFPHQPSGPSQTPGAGLITASTVSALHSVPEPQQSAQSQDRREWSDERSRYERNNSASGRREYYEGTQRRWIPLD